MEAEIPSRAGKLDKSSFQTNGHCDVVYEIQPVRVWS